MGCRRQLYKYSAKSAGARCVHFRNWKVPGACADLPRANIDVCLWQRGVLRLCVCVLRLCVCVCVWPSLVCWPCVFIVVLVTPCHSVIPRVINASMVALPSAISLTSADGHVIAQTSGAIIKRSTPHSAIFVDMSTILPVINYVTAQTPALFLTGHLPATLQSLRRLRLLPVSSPCCL